MRELVHMQGALQYADVQTAMAATMKRECEGACTLTGRNKAASSTQLPLPPAMSRLLRVVGETPRDLRGLPRDGMLHPMARSCRTGQSYSVVAPP